MYVHWLRACFACLMKVSARVKAGSSDAPELASGEPGVPLRVEALPSDEIAGASAIGEAGEDARDLVVGVGIRRC
jgi:hypothetical protein